jgi:PII-like signaling protein
MKQSEEGFLLRIFIGESDRYHGKPLHEAIVMKARELNLAGATVIKGIMGYGATSRVHSTRMNKLSEDLPVIVEIIENEDNINKLMPFLEIAVIEGLITIEKVKLLRYRRVH